MPSRAMPSFIHPLNVPWILFTIQLSFLSFMHCISSSSPSIPIPFSYLVIASDSNLSPHVVNSLPYHALSFLLIMTTMSSFPPFLLILLLYFPLSYSFLPFHCLVKRLYCDIISSLPISYSFSFILM